MVEEFQLQLASIVGVIVRPVLETVALEPFLFRCRPYEALDIAAQMKSLAAPVCRREKWYVNLVLFRRALVEVTIMEGVRENQFREVRAVLC